MGPRKGGGGAPEKVEARTTSTAVLLADSFTQRFRPITVECPKVLLPLVNTPMIEYTLEWLALNQVEEVFFFCCAHADQICKYLETSKWSSAGSGMKVIPIMATNCMSAGEAMRSIDQRDIIKGDFVLVTGDTVSNMALQPVLEAHRARKEKDKSAIMTMVMKPARHPKQRSRLGDSDLVVALDPVTKRLLKYVEFDGDTMSVVKTDNALFSERDCIEIRTDLMDTHIAICSPEVLMLFSDNFDYQNIRRDFVTGVLSEEELGNKLYIHELVGEYAARVFNLRSYDAVSRDIMHRWTFPFVPDTNVLHRSGQYGSSTYRYGRGHRYCESHQVNIARFAVLGEDVCVGAGTSIGDHSRVVQSVIGRGCRLGRHVDIEGSYLQDNVTVEDGVVLRFAMLCEGSVVRQGAVVAAGCIVSYGCVVAAQHHVPPNVRISLCRQQQMTGSLSDDELEYSTQPGAGAEPAAKSTSGPLAVGGKRDGTDSPESNFSPATSLSPSMMQSLGRPSKHVAQAAQLIARGQPVNTTTSFDVGAVGASGAGYGWTAPNDSSGMAWRYSIAMPSMVPDTAIQETAEDEGSVEGSEDKKRDAEDSESLSSDVEAEDLDPECVFKREVGETLLRCVKLRFEQTNVVVELNALKIAENRTFADCARYILTTLLSLSLPIPPNVNAAEYGSLFATSLPDTSSDVGKLALLRSAKKLLLEWASLLKRFLKNEDDQVELLLTLEEFCSGDGPFEADREASSVYRPVFPQLLRQLYDAEVVGEDAVLQWADEKAQADLEDRGYLNQSAAFVEWLRSASSEEESDEDDEEEESDE